MACKLQCNTGEADIKRGQIITKNIKRRKLDLISNAQRAVQQHTGGILIVHTSRFLCLSASQSVFVRMQPSGMLGFAKYNFEKVIYTISLVQFYCRWDVKPIPLSDCGIKLRQITPKARKTIYLAKQTHCRGQLCLIPLQSPQEYLLLVVCLRKGEEKAWQEILREKQHFP